MSKDEGLEILQEEMTEEEKIYWSSFTEEEKIYWSFFNENLYKACFEQNFDSTKKKLKVDTKTLRELKNSKIN